MLVQMAEALVCLPERMMVRQELEGETGKLILYVDASDMERVMGIKGRTQKSLQTVVNAVAARSGGRLSLEIERRDP